MRSCATCWAKPATGCSKRPTAQSALEVAGRIDGPIHLLISDVVMPGMSGGELAEALIAARPETRALLISGYAQHLADDQGAE